MLTNFANFLCDFKVVVIQLRWTKRNYYSVWPIDRVISLLTIIVIGQFTFIVEDAVTFSNGAVGVSFTGLLVIMSGS